MHKVVRQVYSSATLPATSTVAGGLPRLLRGSQGPAILDIASPWRGNPTAQEPSELGGARPLKSRPFEKGGPRGDLGTLSLSEIPLNPPFPN